MPVDVESGGTLALLAALLPFALATSLTPGPNTVMVTASGATFGFRRTLPHILGILVGFPGMLVAIGWGVGGVLETRPLVHATLRWVGAAYLLFLAWKIGTARRADAHGARGAPLGFLQALAFQWVNPKAWMMCVGALSTFTTVGGDLRRETFVIAATFALVSLPALVGWTLFGTALGRLLRTERSQRVFSCAMAALLVASLVPMIV
jgi:threonine/homoserine/homoserine lactone efflux protein